LIYKILLLSLLPLTTLLSFNLETKEIILDTIHKNTATINNGNLIVGQSGIIIHKTQYNSIIIANAIVKSSSNKSSVLTLSKANDLIQDAIPTSNLKAKKGDIFILNHMYNSSLLIVPNYEALQKTKKLYPNQNFLNSDIFAAHLKTIASPTPTIKEIQKFCKSYDIGNIFIVVNNKLHIIDINSLKLIDKTDFYITNKKTQSPFFTKITNITTNFWNFKNNKIMDYHKYYTNILGL
jgi:hypothetical protein